MERARPSDDGATTLPTEHRSTRAEEMMETGSPPSPHVRVGAMPLARLHSESALGPESQEEDTVSDVASTGAEGSKQHERPETAPAQMKRRLRSAGPPDIAGRQKCRKARGTSARTVESRLDALRVDEALREEFLQRVDNIIAGRTLDERRRAGSRKNVRPETRTRKSVQQLLRRAHPLDTERKADLVQELRSAGLEANRATQVLLDPPTKALLALRASKERRAKEARFLDLIKSCEKLRQDAARAARLASAVKEKKLRARKERLRQAWGRTEQTKGWLVVVTFVAVASWVRNGLENAAESKARQAAAKVITRHIAMAARRRFEMRLEAATRAIDEQFGKKIRRWKTKRDSEATSVLLRFLADVKRSDLRTRVKLLAYRVAHAHVQLARLQRWWRRRRMENVACRLVLCRLWEKEVDRRVDVQAEDIWRARQEATLLQEQSEAMLRWPSRHGISYVPGASRDSVFAKGKTGRHAKEARSERLARRARLLLNPLNNPPKEVRLSMCAEYVTQMALRHSAAVGRYKEKLQRITDLQTNKIENKESLLAVSLAVQARRRAMKSKETEIAGLPVRPRWCTRASLREVQALVDAGVAHVEGLMWLLEPSTPSRLEDGTFVADSMPTPQQRAARVARRFRYDEGTAVLLEIGFRQKQGAKAEWCALLNKTTSHASVGHRGVGLLSLVEGLKTTVVPQLS